MATDPTIVARRLEAERLIALARTMLNNPDEEIAAIFLDHAIDALQAIEIDRCAESGPPSSSL